MTPTKNGAAAENDCTAHVTLSTDSLAGVTTNAK